MDLTGTVGLGDRARVRQVAVILLARPIEVLPC